MSKILKINPLTPLQEGMLFHSLLNQEGKNYAEQICFHLEGKVDLEVDLLKETWQQIVNRYEVLRTDFVWKESKVPVQVVLKEKEAEVYVHDISELDQVGQEQYIKDFKEADLNKPFDFANGLLCRLSIIKEASDQYLICLTFHHILLDGWSLQLILQDFLVIYDCLVQGQALPPAPPAQFSSYMDWFKKQDRKQGAKFWANYLEAVSEPTILAGDQANLSGEIIRESRELHFEMDQAKTSQINAFCKQNNITINAFLQTAWGLLLQRYNNTDVSCFGMTVSGRSLAVKHVEEIVGILINTLPVVIQTGEQERVGELLARVNDQLVEIRDYEYMPLPELKRVSQIQEAGEMFNSILAFENYPQIGLENSAFTLSLDTVFEMTNYDFSLSLANEETILGRIIYNTEVFSDGAIQRILASFYQLIDGMLADVNGLVHEISVVSAEEQAQVLELLRGETRPFAKEQTVTQLFEERVAQAGERIAVVDERQQLTYAELNQKANQVARYLREAGVGSEEIVAVMVDQSVEMFIGILGILKAGAAYLPIDHHYPEARIEYMLADSQARFCLTTASLRADLTFSGSVLVLDDPELYTGDGANLELELSSDQLAYIIYTSGSTGQPKGVMIEHQSLLNLVSWHNDYYQVTAADRSTKYAGFGFDASVWEIFPYLVAGAAIYVVPEEIRWDAVKLNEYFTAQQITMSFLPTQICEQFLDTGNTSLRYLVTGGDKLRTFKQQNFTLVNNYGPTENTVVTTAYPVQEHERNIPIGKPIYNAQIYILDQHDQLQPLGAAGELCIGGASLARGYLNRSELTAEKFVPNPFVPGTRMYKTGDLARLLPDGNIQFLGRVDDQVKIRGFRIELGEIENQLLEQDQIEDAVVLDWDDETGNKYLCGYIVAEREVVVEELRASLAETLPDYMIPTIFIQLAQLPVTANGKVDKKALPKPDQSLVAREYVAPTTDEEAKMAQIWSEILRVEQVSIHDNFFELGGHSLKATMLASKVFKVFNVELPLKAIFKYSTVKTLVDFICGKEEKAYAGIQPVEEREYYPVSSAQKRLYALREIAGDDITYNIPMVRLVVGKLDYAAFEAAWVQLVQRHESLRTSFDLVGGQPVQQVQPQVDFTVQYLEGKLADLDQIIRDFVQPFDLTKAPLFRVALVELTDQVDQSALILDLHHIIADGVSVEVLFRELADLYAGQELSPLKVQYKDFANWQNQLFASEEMQEQAEYWLTTFGPEKGPIPVLNLPTDAPRPSVMSNEGDLVQASVPVEILTQLQQLSAAKGTTLYMTLLAAFNVLLHKYTDQEDLVVGSPVAGRRHDDLEHVVGMFVNTLAMRNQPAANKSFSQFLAQVKENSLKAFEHQDYQFEMLVEKLDLQRDLSRNPLFDVMFTVQKADQLDIQMGDVLLTPYEQEYKTAKFDLTLTAVEQPTGLDFYLEYSTKLFTEATMLRFLSHLTQVVEQIVAQPEQKIGEIEIITTAEKQQILNQFNATQTEVVTDLPIHWLFEAQVERTPDQVALVFEGQELTYQELNQRANQLAQRLTEQGVTSDQVVGILVDPALEMIVGILGVLKAGGAYLPIDPAYPEERIEYLLADSGAKILLTQSHLVPQVKFTGQILELDDPTIYTGTGANLELDVDATDLAYVIYTSGSTGIPKGVMIEHHSLVNLVSWHNRNYQVTAADRSTKYAGFGFDASVWEIFPYLVAGATLHILSPELKLNLERLNQYFEANQITISFLPTQICEQFAKLQNRSLRLLLTGGDKLKYFADQNYTLVNNYGPTENTVVTTSFVVDQEYTNIPIGGPVDNCQVYILNQQQQLQPIGVPGELCVVGESLARGYLNRDELTREKFVWSPLEVGVRMYKTGDLVRWLPDGSIEFLGRIDRQVKIRGYRIELGEIENQLLQHPEISDVVVIDRNDAHGNKYLCGYYTTTKGAELTGLKEFLATNLPDYMIPAFFVRLDEMPLTANGKVNRDALPEPVGDFKVEYTAPTTPEQQKLAQIWADILGIEQVGIHNNFFELGGDSIKAIQILARAKEEGIHLTVKDIFTYRTIANLLEHVAYAETKTVAQQDEVTGEVLLTPIQQWFFAKEFSQPQYFNQTNLFAVPVDLDLERLERVLQRVITHHDALRMSYRVVDGQMIQYNRKVAEVNFTLQRFNLAAEEANSIAEISEKLQASLDLERDSLLQAALFELANGEKRLLIAIHHLVVDGISWRILVEDLNRLYAEGPEAKLPLKTTSFQEWSDKLTAYAKRAELDLEYWENLDPAQIQSIASPIELTETETENEMTPRAEEPVVIELDESGTQQLLTKVNWAYNTEINDLLLAALTMAVCEALGTDHLLVDLEGHGREEIISDVDISRTVGWFTSAYPAYFEQQASVDQVLRHVKETLRVIPNKGVNFGIAKYLKGVEGLDQFRPEISFNYLGQFDDSFALQEKQTTLLSGCTEEPGQSVHPDNSQLHLIDINGAVINGQLQLNVTYDSKYLTHQQICQLRDAYQQALLELINHCLAQEERCYTASDFGVQGYLDDPSFKELANRFPLATVKMYPLTPMQEGMLFYHNLNPESKNYFEQFCFYLDGKVQVEELGQAWQEIIQRHEVMRTCFFWKDTDKPIQIVVSDPEPSFASFDLTGLTEAEQAEEIARFKEQDFQQGFDFEAGQLNRFSVLKLSDTKYLVCWAFHHILLDGWSMPLILGDLFSIYQGLIQGQASNLEAAPQFGDYLEWLHQQDLQQGLEFWREYMKDFSDPSLLPYDHKGNKGALISKVGVCSYEYDQELTQRMHQFCNQNSLTANALIQTVWGLLLQKYNNTTESCFGMTVSGRPVGLPNVEQIAGLFINTLPVIVRTEATDTALDLAQRVNNQLVEIREHEYVSLAEIQSMAGQTEELFDSLIVFENYPLSSLEKNEELGFTMNVESVFELTNYDFSISAAVADKTLIRFTYNQDLFTDATINRIQEHFASLLQQILADASQRVQELAIVSEAEKAQLLGEFNATQVDYPHEKTIQQLVSDKAAELPDQVAVRWRDQQLTYAQLEAQANQLARCLQEHGVTKETVVGLMLPRRLEMVVGILGILKAHGVCLPVDLKYPEERIQYLLADSQASVLLKMEDAPVPANFIGTVIQIDEAGVLAGYSTEPVAHEQEQRSDDLAYLVYTSGSTGKPKGVMLHHRGIINHALTKIRELELTATDRLCHNLTINFVASIWQAFAPLMIGAELVIYSEEVIHDAIGLLEAVQHDQVSVVEIVPSLLKAYLELLDEGAPQVELPDLRLLVLTGEKVVPALVNKFFKKYQLDLLNAYGQSECSDDTLHYQIPYNPKTEVIYVGKPANNTQVYVLDQNDNLQPIGIPGELCISGDGLARGYLGRPDLTAERFVDHPFIPGQKMYRTGDLVRWTTDGYIEFLGRIDHQVKIRGYRIEPGEIENQLLSHPVIKEVVVVPRPDASGNDYLAAYLVSEAELSVVELREYLLQELPEYMVPAAFVRLEKMPLTPNGKINRKALPEVDGELSSGRSYLAPRDEVEEKLVKIWSQVIKVDKIGIQDDFFQLGGHSLKAGILVAKINKQFEVELPLSEIFTTPTIEGLARLIRGAEQVSYGLIERVAEAEYYPVSSAQKRLFVLNQLKDQDTSYNVSGAFIIAGDLKRERLAQTLQELVNRHEAFRTSFTIVDGEPMQQIASEVTFNLAYQEVEADEIEAVAAEFVQPFELSQAPLMRASLVRYDDKHLFQFDLHHIIADGSSMSIFINELLEIYRGAELPELQIQYKDFSAWQNQFFTTEMYRQQEAFWLEEFAGEIPVLNMPLDYQRPAEISFAGGMVDLKVEEELTQQIQQLSSEQGATFYMTLLAAFNILLAKYTNQDDLVVGTPIANRRHADLDQIIGMFVNTLALRNQYRPAATFAEYLSEVKQNLLQVYENQDYQFEMLVEKLDLTRELNRNPLFDVMLVLQNMDEMVLESNGLRLIPHQSTSKVAKFDLTLYAYELEDGIQFALEYATSLFKAETVQRLLGHLVNIFTAVVENPQITLAEIDLLSPAERSQIVTEFNQTAVSYPEKKLIHQLFEEAVERTPDQPALIFGETTLTYRELNQRANQLARQLRERGVEPNQLVGILVERSIEMIVGIYGILKAGGAYMPLDPEYPEERIEYMLEDSGAKLLLTQPDFMEKVQFDGAVLNLEDVSLYIGDASNLNVAMTSEDLVYIIYTSGSTGKPKGVLIEHRNLVNVITALHREYPLTEEDAYLLKTTYIFDVSEAEIYGWFMGNGKLVILEPGAEKETRAIVQAIHQYGVTHINFVPSMLKILLTTLEQKDIEILDQLKYVFVAGEAISKELVRKFYRMLPDVIFENIYGPTESTIYATKYSLIHLSDQVNVPIGKPLANIQTYIVDRLNNLQPIGVPGELCLAGKGLARGYLNQPELTAEKFIANPFTKGEERMYKTGDLARWLPDGNIEYLGRIDHQVKVRGFRIELGEIEGQLLAHSAIREAVVIDRVDADGNKYLCAYVISDQEVSDSDLRAHLAEELPEYMVPSYFVHLDAIPLSASGKVNRKALPAPDQSVEVSSTYYAPTNQQEEQMVAIWQEILHIDQIGILDNFFELGGDSIKAIQISSRAAQIGMKVLVKDIFKHKTVAEIVHNLDQADSVQKISQGEVTGEVLLTPIQNWFFGQVLTYPQFFNQNNLFRLPKDVDLNLLEQVLQTVIKHHDALRMSYQLTDDGGIRQINRGVKEVGAQFSLQRVDLSTVEATEQEAELQKISAQLQTDLNLEQDLLFQGIIFDLGDQGQRLLLSIHHLVIDGVSWRILLEDIENLYTSELAAELPLKTTSFKEWSQKLNEYAQTHQIDGSYWEEIDPSQIQSLVAEPVVENHLADHQSLLVELSAEQTEKLMSRVNWAYNTEINDILLAGLTMAVTQAFGLDNLLVNLEGHGREEILEGVDISRTIGWFTSIYPVYFEQQGQIGATIKHVKESLRQIPNKGLNYGLATELQQRELLGVHPEISFNYLGQFDGVIDRESLLSRCSENAGSSFHLKNNHAHLMDINGVGIDGKLQLAISYNAKYLDADQMTKLQELLAQSLNDLIDHCVQKSERDYTASDFGLTHIVAESEFTMLAKTLDLEKVKLYPLTPMQEGMLFHTLLDETSRNYCEQITFYLNGQMDPEQFSAAWREVAQRHQIFRTALIREGLKQPIQVIQPEAQVTIQEIDLTHLDASEQTAYIQRYKEEDLDTGFDFAAGKLSRITVIKLAEERHWIDWAFHHILLDGWSVQIVLGEFFEIYHHLVTDQASLPRPKADFSNYLDWLQEQDQVVGLNFWSNYLGDFSEPTLLPADQKVSKGSGVTEVGSLEYTIDAEETAQIEEFCRAHNITINTLVQTAWGLLLQKYNNTQASCFGTTVSGRPANLPDVEGMVGIFINTLPVMIEATGQETVRELLQKVNRDLVEMREYEYISLAEIQQQSAAPEKLFDSILVFENYLRRSVEADKLEFSVEFDSTFEMTNYDFSMTVMSHEVIDLKASYNKALFSASTIEQIYGHLAQLITGILTGADQPVSQLSIISAAEREQVLVEFNATQVDYPAEQTIQQLFEAQAAATPDRTALVFGETELSYRELNQRANQLARRLRGKGVGPDHVVGIMVDKSLEMIIGVLAIIKAGGAYLPIDIDYPASRVEFMLKDAGAKLLLTETDTLELDFTGKVLNITNPDLYVGETANLENINSAHDLIYIIYTSGSTGKPKGVMIEHKNVNRLISNSNMLKVTADDRILQTGSLAFDASTFEIWGSLLNGATLYLISKDELLSPQRFAEQMHGYGITMIWMTAPLFNQFLEENPTAFANLQTLIVGGDALSPKHINQVRGLYPELTVLNGYGPTESTTFTTYFKIEQDYLTNIPIGWPVSNTQVYVLDRYQKLQPIGVPGELTIGGDGLARGYLNRPELTAEKFVANPFTGGEMYRTGDLVRWLPDGTIEFLGRIDHQVKIRGFRIELDEIEKQFLTHPEVKEVVVLAKEDAQGSKYLCAYLVTARELATPELKDYLSQELPDYMIPSFFISLEQMPLTANGKIDRRALPEPDGDLRVGSAEYVAPTTDQELRMAKIWSQILGLRQIGIHDNFFDLGGHSLKATQLASKITKEFDVVLPLKEIFQKPTIHGLVDYIVGMDQEEGYAQIEVVAEQDYYPVSSAQKRIFAIEQMEGASTLYNIPSFMFLEGELQLEEFTGAFEELIQRHEALRTSFTVVDGQPVQKIHPEVEFALQHFVDATGELTEAELKELFTEFVRPFDLTKAPLMRVGLMKISEEKHLFMLDLHHIISDGTSTDILFTELAALYAGQELPELRVQYKDFSAWQNQLFASEKMQAQEDYWLATFKDAEAGELPVLNFPTDEPRPAVMSFAGDNYSFEMEPELLSQIKELASSQGATLYMVLLSAFNLLLSKYARQEDIVVGSPIAGRRHADLENILGMFVNTLAMRNQPVGSKTFVEFLTEVKENSLKAFDNQDYQFEMLVDQLDLERDLSRNPLFDVLFVLQNANEAGLAMEGLQFRPCEIGAKIAKFDLTLSALEANQQLYCNLEYRTELFKPQTIARISRHLVQILEQIVANPQLPLTEIVMITAEERREIIEVFNDTTVAYPQEQTIQQLFEKQAARTPDKVAVVFADQSLTYAELNSKANQLARQLRAKGIDIDQPVGIMADKSLELMIGILAIVKAGGAYLPIDIDYPESRVEYMLADSKAKLLLIQPDLFDQVEFTGEKIDLTDPNLYTGDDSNLEHLNEPDDLIYIIYTSGSTGKPKGVMVKHLNVNRLISNSNMLIIDQTDRILQTGSMAFDASTFEVWGSLLNGATLYLISKDDLLSPDRFEAQLKEHHVTMIWLTAPLFNQLLEQKPSIFSELQTLIVGGDALSPKHINLVRQHHPALQVINGYGPTESTTFTTHFRIKREYETNIPIGYPVSNTQVYILDGANKLQPVGVPGELCICGDGLARGYLGEPELTAEKFVAKPDWLQSAYPATAGEKMYRTGDLVRWLPDGTIEFMGRIDYQVKIRGFRIELSEIESRLLEHAMIKEAVVIDRVDEQGKKYLCAYLVTSEEVSIAELREHCGQELPDYMIPSYFVALDKMPLTSNGKVDRKALPEPDGEITTGTEYVAPTTEVEATLAKIWEDILGVSKVGLNDNFFEYGGDSIKAIQILARANQAGINITVKDIFRHKTIANLLANVDYSVQKTTISQAEVTGEVLLLPIQKWFFDEQLRKPHYFNQGNLFKLHPDTDRKLLEQAFIRLIEHHDALRMGYRFEAEGVEGAAGVTQYNRSMDEVEFALEIIDLSHLSSAEQTARIRELGVEIQDQLDLEHDLLIKAIVFELGQNGQRLFIPIHHLVVDGVSWRILLEDLENLYQSNLEKLPPKTTSYQEWSERLTHYAQTRKVDVSYWEGIDHSKLTSLVEGIESELSFKDGQPLLIELDEEYTDQLLTKINWVYNTEINDLLLSALTLAMTDQLGQAAILLNLEGHGREEIIDEVDLSRTIGWFTSAYPVYFEKQATLEATIKYVKESLRKIPNKGLNFGVAKYLNGHPELQQLKPEISFNYLGQFDGSIETKADTNRLLTSSTEDVGPYVHGDNQHGYLIDINGMVINNKLQLTMNYNGRYLEEAEMLELQQAYIRSLKEIIDHCMSQTTQNFTVSDFELGEDMDDDEFDLLNELYDFA